MASRTTPTPWSIPSITAAVRSLLAPFPCSPGPRHMASIPADSSRTATALSAAMSPLGISVLSATTRASGAASAISLAAVSATASRSWPAPTLSAARPASSAAPGVLAAPPTMRTTPRACLSTCGGGRGQARRSWSVTGTNPSGEDVTGVGLLGRWRALFLDRRRGVVGNDLVAGVVSAKHGQPTVCVLGPPHLRHGRGLVESCQKRDRELHHDVMGHDQQPLGG